MAAKEAPMDLRSDADLQAIQTSVAFKNISDAVEQYRRQFGLAFLALIAFSAIHVGLVVIANLYTMQTRVSRGVLTDAADSSLAVSTGASHHTYDLAFIMTNLDERAQIRALNDMKSASFVDKDNTYRQYTVTGFQLGGYKRSELKLYTSVGHILEFVRGKGIRVFSETASTSSKNCTTSEGRRKLLQWTALDAAYQASFNGMSDSAKEKYIEANLPKLKAAVGDAISGAKMEVNQMSQTGWGTDSSTWENIVYGAINKQWSGLGDSYKAAFEADAAAAGGSSDYGGDDSMSVHDDDTADWDLYVNLYAESNTAPGDDDTFESGMAMYNKAMAEHGMNYDQMVNAKIGEVLTTIEDTTAAQIDHWSSFKSTRFLGYVEASPQFDSSVSGYGCMKSNFDAMYSKGTDGEEMMYHVCIDGASTEIKMMGGFFFSEVMGSYEAFIMKLPANYCDDGWTADDSKKELDFGDDMKVEYYLYLMHGWGESGFVLVEAASTIEYMSDNGLSLDFLTICPEDSGSPWGGKTWYTNNAFTGYHMDMIVFELPMYIEESMALLAAGKGVFGFSMGAAGALNIGFTYSTVFEGIAAFNAPIDANDCFYWGYCHTYCGVDSFKCEILWTSTQSAYNAFVVVAAGGMLNTGGYFDPVAYGIAAAAIYSDPSVAGCIKDIENMVSTFSSGQLQDSFMTGCSDVTNGGKSYCSPPAYTSGEAFASLNLAVGTLPAFVSADYAYLDASIYAISSSGYYPTHNPMTGAVNEDAWYTQVYQFPIWRITNNKEMFDPTGIDAPTYMLIACDENDQYGLSAMADSLAEMFTGGQAGGSPMAGYKFDGGVIHDKHTAAQGACGHCMDLRDFRLAYQFFSDVFETMQSGDATTWSAGGKSKDSEGHWPEITMSWVTSDTCPVYMGPNLLKPASWYGHLNPDFTGACSTYDSTKTADFATGLDFADDWAYDASEHTTYINAEAADMTSKHNGRTAKTVAAF